MIDPLAVLDDVCFGLGGDESPSVPGFHPSVPGAFPGSDASQPYDIVDISRISRSSRSENRGVEEIVGLARHDNVVAPDHTARTSSYVQTPGTPGTPGNGAKSLAESTSPQFPVKDLEPGTPGTEAVPCGRPFLDLNLAKPQRSDWWTGDLMAEVDRAIPPPGAPLPISMDEVRAGVARELRALAEDGREGSAALRDAVEITRAKIRNSEALAERQVHGGQCHVCDGPLDDGAPVVAVLSGKPGRAIHMHAGCCEAYSARRAALVDRIMGAAGYGAEAEGNAA